MRICFVLLSLLLLFVACRKKVVKENIVVIGQLEVDLNANEDYIRTQEAPIGNFICDAIKEELESKNTTCDFVMMNAGGIRFDPEKRPSGIYPKGNFTAEMVDEMLPFTQNTLVKVKISGFLLKKVLERSVASLPLDKGSFLQFSDGIVVQVNLANQAQILDETVSPPILISNGERIVSVEINGEPLQNNKEYEVITVNYLTNGNDGFVSFLEIDAAKKTDLSDLKTNLVKDYVTLKSPLKPEIVNRIIF